MNVRLCGVLVALVFVVGVRAVEAQCTATVTPTSVAVPSFGSTSAVSVIAGTSCSWTVTTSASWITVNGSGTGSGIGQISYTIDANPTTAVRIGTLTVLGQTVTFTQAVDSCVYSVTPTNIPVPLGASAYSLSVSAGTRCSWTAVSAVTWITVTAGASGIGIGVVTFAVAATTAPRTGTLTIAGHVVTVPQGGGQPLPAAPTNLRVIR